MKRVTRTRGIVARSRLTRCYSANYSNCSSRPPLVQLVLDPRNGRRRHPWERRRLEREKRDRQPAVQRRRAEAQQRHLEEMHAMNAEWEAKECEDEAQPLHEMMHELFDFADPELWKSNSFATLRPRLIIYIQAAVARLEYEQVSARGRGEIAPRLAKAREILELLQGRPAPAKTVADGGDPGCRHRRTMPTSCPHCGSSILAPRGDHWWLCGRCLAVFIHHPQARPACWADGSCPTPMRCFLRGCQIHHAEPETT
jgi:ribosomal protein S27AE